MKSPGALLGLTLAVWLPFAVVLTVLVGLVATAVQQDLRQGANDPQIQMAEDAARLLAAGHAPTTLVPTPPVELSASLAPYLLIFDDAGHLRAGGAVLDGAPPVVPPGVFETARQQGTFRFSWAPRPSVREAAVLIHVTGAPGGFVLAGRALREVEAREDSLTALALLGWGVGLVLTLGASAGLAWLLARLLAPHRTP